MTLSPGRSPCTIRPSAGYISGRSDGCGELTSRPKGLDRVGDRGRVPFDALSLLVPVLGPSPSRGPSLPVLAGGPPGTRTLNPPTRRVPAEDELAPIPITRASNPELASPTRRSGTRHNTHTERRISRRRRERRTAHTRSWRSTHGSPVMDAAQSLSSMSLWRCEAPRASPSGQEEASRSCISCARRGPASRPARPSARVGRGR